MPPLISVIVPVYDERENLETLVTRLQPVLENATDGSFEALFVDDGSHDGSSEMLDAINVRDPRFKVIHLSRNFGHQAALQAGLDASNGRAIVLMDADLQDPPELLGQFIAKWREGYEVVYAVRTKRQESLWKRAAYNIFYRVMRVISEIDTPIDAGDFCLMDARVVQKLVDMREQNRFLRGLRSWVGFKQIGIEFERPTRLAGKSKYTLRKLVHLALSGYVGFSTFPLRLAAWLGIVSASAGFITLVWVLVSRLTDASHIPQGWASTSALILFIGGVQLIMLGVMGEYLGRVYDEVRRRPLYVVGSRVGFLENREQPAAVAADYWLQGQRMIQR